MWEEDLKRLLLTHVLGGRDQNPDDRINHVIKFENQNFRKVSKLAELYVSAVLSVCCILKQTPLTSFSLLVIFMGISVKNSGFLVF